MECIRLTSEHDAELAAFLDAAADANPGILAYHHPFYRDALAAGGVGEPLYLGLRQGGRLAGVLPGFLRRAEAGTVYASMPYFGPNAGPLTEDNADTAAQTALLQGLLAELEHVPDMVSASVYTPFSPTGDPARAACEAAMPDALVIDRFTQFLDLDEAAWDKKTRYDIRRGAKLGLTVSDDADPGRFEAFHALYAANCADRGIPMKDRSLVRDVFTGGLESGNAVFLTALLDGDVVGGLLVLHSRATASYYIPCADDEHRSLQPGMLLIDRAVDILRERGVRWWNWEGSPSRESGVYRFKKRWGSAEADYSIHVLPYREPGFYRALGPDELARQFPHFFVYPFDRL